MAKQNSSPSDLSLAQRLYQGDPLLLWLRDRRRISYPAWIVVFALFGFSLLAFLPALTGARSVDSRAIATSSLPAISPLLSGLLVRLGEYLLKLFDPQ